MTHLQILQFSFSYRQVITNKIQNQVISLFSVRRTSVLYGKDANGTKASNYSTEVIKAVTTNSEQSTVLEALDSDASLGSSSPKTP